MGSQSDRDARVAQCDRVQVVLGLQVLPLVRRHVGRAVHGAAVAQDDARLARVLRQRVERVLERHLELEDLPLEVENVLLLQVPAAPYRSAVSQPVRCRRVSISCCDARTTYRKNAPPVCSSVAASGTTYTRNPRSLYKRESVHPRRP